MLELKDKVAKGFVDGISLEDVVRELARRHVIDKKVKQERMQ